MSNTEHLRKLAVNSNDGYLCGPALSAADEIDRLRAERDRLREALDYAFKEMTGAYSAIDGHFSASEIELDQSIADAHAGLHVAMHTAAIALEEAGQ